MGDLSLGIELIVNRTGEERKEVGRVDRIGSRRGGRQERGRRLKMEVGRRSWGSWREEKK